MGRDLAKRMFLVLTPILLLPLLISSLSGGSVNSSEKVFHGKKTTCSASQMQSLIVENLASFGEPSKDFLDVFEFMDCSICHLIAEIQSLSPCICDSPCERVFEACSDAYFTSNASFDHNSDATKEGFTVQIANDSKEEPFNGSKASLEPVMKLEWSEEQVKWFKLVNKQLITCVIALVLKAIMFYIRRLDEQDIAMDQAAGNMNGDA